MSNQAVADHSPDAHPGGRRLLQQLEGATGGRDHDLERPGPASPASSCPHAPTYPVLASIGKGEGKLNVIAWEGYTEPQWVKPFEQQTGCQVDAK